MTDLTIRKLLIDLDTPFDIRWNGGDAFTSAFMNALSMSFPVGEQFFIDSLRRGIKELPPRLQAEFTQDVKGFIGQEATHRRIHELFNRHVLNHGMVNHWELRVSKRVEHINKKKAIHAVAITAAYEHYTSVFASWLLKHPEFLAQASERLQTLWLWHASEETEHRCVSFDIYRAMGGNEVWRKRWMITVTVFFSATFFARPSITCGTTAAFLSSAHGEVPGGIYLLKKVYSLVHFQIGKVISEEISILQSMMTVRRFNGCKLAHRLTKQLGRITDIVCLQIV